MRPKSYEEWRKRKPFTDAEIAEALETLAAEMEWVKPFLASFLRFRARQASQGFVSRKDFCMALPVLVKTCSVCGKPALYRVSYIGRCRKHRDFAVKQREAIRDLHEAREHRIAQFQAAQERVLRKRERLAKTAKFGKSRPAIGGPSG